MTVMHHDKEEGVVTSSSTSWVDVFSASKDLYDGAYFIWGYMEYTGALTTEVVGVRALLDGVEGCTDYHYPEIADQYKAFSPLGFIEVTGFPPELGVPESHTIKFQHRVADVSQTVKTRRRRIMVMKE